MVRNEAQFARSLARIAANDPTLTRVDFYAWGIGDEGAGRLVTALQSNTNVRHLDLENNDIGAALMLALVGVLGNSTTLVVLELNGNDLGDEGALAMAGFLRNNSSLVTLYLSSCGIGVDGVRALAAALLINSSLVNLHLGGNSFGDAGASVLAGLLPGNSTLNSIGLSGNGISDAGAMVLAEELPNNSSLAYLNLDGNNISDVGARLLVKALLVNCTVISPNLVRNDISEALERLVDELAQINRGTYIDSEEIGDLVDLLAETNTDASNPQEALGLKVAWLRNLHEGGLNLLGFEESGVEEEILRLDVVCRVGWLINSGVDGEKEAAVTLALDQLEHFPQADQRRGLFQRLLSSPYHGEEVAESVNETTARTLYRYAAEGGAARGVLMNLLRAHESLCTCRDVKHKLYPFMLLAAMPEAGVGDVMEVIKMDPTIVRSGICQTVAKNKRKRGSTGVI